MRHFSFTVEALQMMLNSNKKDNVAVLFIPDKDFVIELIHQSYVPRRLIRDTTRKDKSKKTVEIDELCL